MLPDYIKLNEVGVGTSQNNYVSLVFWDGNPKIAIDNRLVLLYLTSYVSVSLYSLLCVVLLLRVI